MWNILVSVLVWAIYIFFLLFFSRSPISVAAAAIYMASQASADKKSQKGKFKVFYWEMFQLCDCHRYV